MLVDLDALGVAGMISARPAVLVDLTVEARGGSRTISGFVGRAKLSGNVVIEEGCSWRIGGRGRGGGGGGEEMEDSERGGKGREDLPGARKGGDAALGIGSVDGCREGLSKSVRGVGRFLFDLASDPFPLTTLTSSASSTTSSAGRIRRAFFLALSGVRSASLPSSSLSSSLSASSSKASGSLFVEKPTFRFVPRPDLGTGAGENPRVRGRGRLVTFEDVRGAGSGLDFVGRMMLDVRGGGGRGLWGFGLRVLEKRKRS